MATTRPNVSGFPSEPDAIFQLAADAGLRVPSRLDAEAALRKLELRINRDPLDLLSHVRRILLLIDIGNPAAIWAAMIDIYLALGSQGRALRQVLLERATPYLPDDEVAFLEQKLDEGLRRTQRLPIATGARLSPGLIGAPQLVREPTRRAQAAVVAAQEASVLVLAQALLEDGDLASARDLLEQAWIAEPGRADIAEELYEIHSRLKDRAALIALRERLQASGGELPDSWSHLLAEH